MENFYAILGISFSATKEEIKEAYKRKSKQYHPDKGGTDRQFILINNAYEILMDDEKRYQYDQEYKKFYEDLFMHNQSQHFREASMSANIKRENTTKHNSNPSKRNGLPISSYVLNGILILLLAFVWYNINQGKQSLVNEKESLTQRVSDLKRSNSDLKKELSMAQKDNDVLDSRVATLQRELTSTQQDNSSTVTSSSNTNEPTSSALIDVGSTKEDVKRIMGTPTSIENLSFFTVWYYGLSSINFDSSGKVDGWRNTGNNLKLR